MSFDLNTLTNTIADHGVVVRVVLVQVKGSAPRDIGTAMLVWADGQDGTIGGGTLEFEAAARARQMIETGTDRQGRTVALGPDMGQCCGGAVTLLWERFEAATLPENFPYVRPVMAAGDRPAFGRHPGYSAGWFAEDRVQPDRAIWIYGAGHVGRAIVDVLAPLPDLTLTWVDTGADRFPSDVPNGVDVLVATDPTQAVRHAPDHAEHLVLTYSHDLDLGLCHAILSQPFGSAGLIGSATKWARFRKRLAGLGHAPVQINRILCPIGAPELGKHPQAIAIGVATDIVKGAHRTVRLGELG
ncbi:xanthine dehydrogenase accessory protein XdhC [Thalassobium sp. R2A62]|jgi:xanthine dehydrogenase accessory factor|uniref:xanthine dehydrogenase accessory protein XdhC n=1 Tax=Thalassobium sp. R2A62 TaxID=633131 RepID=UPI0001B1CEAA|nr:xanthine dehydrogenase accessory protein XdhC [Thalassobium sp. R2A62]EET46621.1 xanthine dehydrogenase accessory protein XdhC [Thalassobium sp. R2A62]MDG1339718.1 xanthine dehydrogenase accessory protein XdhC [Paracoccaceae bacterium]MDG1803221.1 xanthine dehydrogenase accessory protein XdhC [Paracoccaceae bacterium]MDG2451262.1 xanthine dehydrogenase accessory protein XdhC [Paracoccaceae bacterium]